MMPHIHQLAQSKNKFWRQMSYTVIGICVFAVTVIAIMVWVLI